MSKITRAEKRLQGTAEVERPPSEPPRKSRRLLTNPGMEKPRNEYVLPARCIICKRDKWIKDAATCKRVKERLANVETETGKNHQMQQQIFQCFLHCLIVTVVRSKPRVVHVASCLFHIFLIILCHFQYNNYNLVEWAKLIKKIVLQKTSY